MSLPLPFYRFKKKTLTLAYKISPEKLTEILQVIKYKKLQQSILKEDLFNSLEQKTINDDGTKFILCITKVNKTQIATSEKGDPAVKIWDFHTRTHLFNLKGHYGNVNSIVAISKTIIASISNFQSLRLWNLSTKTCISTIDFLFSKVNNVIVLKLSHLKVRRVYLSFASIKTIDINGFYLVKFEDEKITNAAKLNENQIVCGYNDQYIKIFEVSSKICLKEIYVETVARDISVMNEELVFFTGYGRRSIDIWDTSSGKLFKSLNGNDYFFESIMKVDKRRIASGCSEYSIKIWDIITGNCLTSIYTTDMVHCLAKISRTQIVSGSESGLIEIWNIN